MANTKRVRICGSAPFDLHEDASLQPTLAYISSPVSGLKIEWSERPCEMRANEFGGKTAHYRFVLSGCDSVSFAWLDAFKRNIKRIGGEIVSEHALDVDVVMSRGA